MKSVKGRKEGKDEEIKGKAIRPFEEVKSQSVRIGAVLKNYVSESKQKRRKIGRVRENTQ